MAYSTNNTIHIEVINPAFMGLGGGSSSATVQAVNPLPELTGITPQTADAATGAISVTLTGTGFVPGGELLLSNPMLSILDYPIPTVLGMGVTMEPATTVEFVGVRSGLLFDEPQVQFIARFRDVNLNLTDNIGVNPLVVTVTRPNNGGTLTWNLERLQTGEYRVTNPIAFTQAGVYALTVGILTVADQGFFSVVAPTYLNSVAAINAVGRDQTGYIPFLATHGLDFGRLSSNQRSLHQIWRIVYKDMNRIRVNSLPPGFEVSSDNGANWLRLNGMNPQASSDNGETWVNAPNNLLTLTSTSSTLPVATSDPAGRISIPAGYAMHTILVRFHPTNTTPNEAAGILQLNSGALSVVTRLQARRIEERLTARVNQIEFPYARIEFTDLSPGTSSAPRFFSVEYANICNGTVFLNKKRVKIRHLYWS